MSSGDVPSHVVAMFDLASGREGELVLHIGEVLAVHAQIDANWFVGDERRRGEKRREEIEERGIKL